MTGAAEYYAVPWPPDVATVERVALAIETAAREAGAQVTAGTLAIAALAGLIDCHFGPEVSS